MPRCPLLHTRNTKANHTPLRSRLSLRIHQCKVQTKATRPEISAIVLVSINLERDASLCHPEIYAMQPMKTVQKELGLRKDGQTP